MDTKTLLDLFKKRTDESDEIEKQKENNPLKNGGMTQINVSGNAEITVHNNYGYDKTGLTQEDQAEVDALIYKLKHKNLNSH